MKLIDINPEKVYLAKRYFNSKKITWQPATVNLTPYKDINGYDIVEVKFLDNQTGRCFSRDGELVDSLGKPTLKPVTGSWLKRELEKINQEIKQLEYERDILLKIKI